MPIAKSNVEIPVQFYWNVLIFTARNLLMTGLVAIKAIQFGEENESNIVHTAL